MSKNTRPMVRIHDTATDEVIDREMNDEEFAQYEASKSAHAEIVAENEAKEIARLATIEKLAALGLTPEDLAAL